MKIIQKIMYFTLMYIKTLPVPEFVEYSPKDMVFILNDTK